MRKSFLIFDVLLAIGDGEEAIGDFSAKILCDLCAFFATFAVKIF
jgi:hypothetical protein